MQIKNEYPSQLLNYLANVVSDSMLPVLVMSDEYIFSTYFTAMMQGLSSGERSASYDSIGAIINSKQRGFVAEDIDFLSVELDKQERLMKVVDGLRAQFSEQVTTTYVRDFFFAITVFRFINEHAKNSSEATKLFRSIIQGIVQATEERRRGTTSIAINISRLGEILDLTQAEARLLELNLLFSTDVRSMIFRDFLFSVMKNPSMFDHTYKVMLGADLGDTAAVDHALSERSTPLALGIVSYDRKTKRMSVMSDFWVFTITNYLDEDEKFFNKFVEPMREKKRSFSGAIAKIQSEKDEILVKEFLEEAARIKVAEKEGEAEKDDPTLLGNNILFYGGRNLDKLGYVYTLLKEAGFEPWKVRVNDGKPGDIPAICLVAQRYLQRKNEGHSVLVIDNAEQALTKQRNRPSWYLDMFGDDGADETKQDDLDSDEKLLIANPVPTIWLTSSPSSITPENVGRFLIHAELKGGSRKDRREEVQKICDDLEFSSDIAQQLSMYYELSGEQIKSAARTTSFLDRAGPEGEQTLVHLIQNSQKALNRDKTEQLRASVTQYNLDLLNINGTMDPDRIIQAMKRNPVGTLCFYGLPGTGKTALAEHIAMKLDMPITIKPASELLSMWLGESEKNIAKMFDEARAEGSILLLDEADSFLRDRSQAQRSWEVTQVNELLQRMERFPGIFICTTNLFQAIDAAALRRFTFKLEFMALRPDQRLRMLANEAEIDLSAMTEAERMDLEINCQLIRYLTPGDFATVKRQANLLGEKLSVAEWLKRLELESKAKLVGIERNAYGQDPFVPEVTPRKRGE